MTPEELAIVTPWPRDAWRAAYSLVAADDRLNWDDLVRSAINVGEGPRLIAWVVAAMELRPIPEMTSPGGAA